MALAEGYVLAPGVATPEEYCALRLAAGMSGRSLKAARQGLPNTLFGVTVRVEGALVGMGRVIGDGALAMQVVDIAVQPGHQGRGVGKAIMTALMAHLRATAPASAYLSLLADGEAHRLYAQYGFKPTAPASIGMAQVL